MGNSVRITENHIYGNTTGIASDTLSAPGHPGYPADGMLIDNNLIYSNNLDLYGVEPPPVEPLVPMPIGTGVVWPGMNGGAIRDNYIFDNWRHGAVLLAVPDAVAGRARGQRRPGGPLRGHRRSRPPRAATASTATSWAGRRRASGSTTAVDMFGNKHGARGQRVAAQRGRLLVGRVRRQQRQLLVRATPAPTGPRARSPARATGSRRTCCRATATTSVGNGDAVKEAVLARLLAVLARRHARRPSALLLVPDAAAAGQRAGRSAERRQMRRQAEAFLRSPRGRALQRRIDGLAAAASERSALAGALAAAAGARSSPAAAAATATRRRARRPSRSASCWPARSRTSRSARTGSAARASASSRRSRTSAPR